MKIHKIQKEIIKLLSDNGDTCDYKLRQLVRLTSATHPQQIVHHSRALEQKGYITINKETNKVHLINSDIVKEAVHLKVYNYIDFVGKNFINEKNIKDYYLVSKKLFNIKNEEKTYILIYESNEMSPKIKRGDMVLVKQQARYKSGDICVINVNGTIEIAKIIPFEEGYCLLYNTESRGRVINDKYEIKGRVTHVINSI